MSAGPATSAHELLSTETCAAYGCGNDAEFADGLCEYHETLKIRGELPDAAAPALARSALERIRAIPNRAPEAEGPARPARTSAQPWTREEAIAAIAAYVDREGHPPRSDDWKSANGLPSYPSVTRVFGSTAAAIAALEKARAVAAPSADRGADDSAPDLVATSNAGDLRPPESEASAEGDEADSGAGLVRLAERIAYLTSLREQRASELAECEAELRAAVEECQAALEDIAA